VTAVPSALEAHERVNGHAATRQSVLARPVIAPYTRRIVDPPRLKFLSRAVDFATTMIYKGMMLSDVPNMAAAVGYTNASWTLKCDLIAQHVCRLLNHMRARGYVQVTPRRDPAMQETPVFDFTSGYVQRAASRLPKQGDRAPWRLYQNYVKDLLSLRHGRVDDPALEFTAVVGGSAFKGFKGSSSRGQSR
jgi:hypothetical protein